MEKTPLTSMLPPTLASRGGRGLSLSFLRPFRLGLREFAVEERGKKLISKIKTGFLTEKSIRKASSVGNIFSVFFLIENTIIYDRG